MAVLVLTLLAAFTAGCSRGGAGTDGNTVSVSVTRQETTGRPQAPFPFVTGTVLYPSPASPLPVKGAPAADTTFHTSVTRITDRERDGYSGAGISNEYARSDPENSDGTRLVLRGNDGSWYVYDAASFKPLITLPADIIGGAPEFEPRWDAADPKVFYYLYGTELRSYDTETGASTTVHDFRDEFPWAAYITTKSEGDASVDRGFWCFAVEDADFRVREVVAFDREVGMITGRRSGFPDEVNWVSSDMSGTHCLVGYDSRAAQVFSRDLTMFMDLPSGASGHIDLAVDADEEDVAVYQNVATDWIAMADLTTGEETNLVELPFNENPDLGLHISGNNNDVPGWVLVSTYGARNPPPGSSHSWMDNQLFMVELKRNPRIWRLAHTHSYTSIDYTGEKVYFAEAFAAINTRGTRVYFASNWENPVADYSEVYQVSLPLGWEEMVPR